ncbi:MAG: hypothetical protein D6681_08810 [Calditrichaeota bacterium]|nr:MAG: hypothetical protein D6681_08810 [Calditrichota bacterium]
MLWLRKFYRLHAMEKLPGPRDIARPRLPGKISRLVMSSAIPAESMDYSCDECTITQQFGNLMGYWKLLKRGTGESGNRSSG